MLAMWRATVLTLFPEMFPGPLGVSLAGKALASGLWTLETRATSGIPLPIAIAALTIHPPVAGREWCCAPTCWRRRSTRRHISPDRPRLLMSPRGRPLAQSRVMELAAGPGPLIVCGRFEGVDQRVD